MPPRPRGSKRYLVRGAEGTAAHICQERGYDIVAEIAEIGSGLSLNRPGIREMAGLAHRHMIDAVLVSDISRLCRDCGQTLRLEGKLKKQGVSIESIKGNPLPEYRRARIALGCIMK